MGKIIFILLVCLLIYSAVHEHSKEQEDRKNNPEKYEQMALKTSRDRNEIELYPIVRGKYIGGIDDIAVECHAKLIGVSDEELMVRMNLDFAEDGEVEFKIPYSNMNSLSMKTESQISKDVTLTRLVLMGAFAFGAKKKTVNTDVFAIINYNNSDGKEQSIIMSISNDITTSNNFKRINGLYYNYKNSNKTVV